MNGPVTSHSTFLKIFQEALGFAANIAKDIRAGDLVGAATRFAIISLSFFFAMFIVALISTSWNEEGNSFCWIALLAMALIAVLLLLLIFRRPPDDDNLSGGQSIRVRAINPIPI